MTTPLQDAQVAKLVAETQAIEAAELWAVEQRAFARERNAFRRKSMEVDFRQNEAHAIASELGLVQAQRAEALLLSDWRFGHTLNFVGAVGKDTVASAIDRLHQFTVTDPGCAITITFNSPGGSVIDGMALFDYIRFIRGQGHEVTIIALGYAASMAGILIQSADIRVMARGSWLLIHEVAFSAGGKIGEVEDMYKFGERLKKQAADIFIERSNGKLTREVLDANWTRKDWWLDPTESLALGLIDEIR